MNDEWATPQSLFSKLDEEFNFTVDLCTNIDTGNSKCKGMVFDIESYVKNDIANESDVYWMNPPYSRGNIDMCMEQATTLLHRGHVVVCLVRFDPSTKWFQRFVDGVASEVRMLDKRVRFIGAPSAYNFPCCVVIYDPDFDPFEYVTNYSIWGEDE